MLVDLIDYLDKELELGGATSSTALEDFSLIYRLHSVDVSGLAGQTIAFILALTQEWLA